jgi:uncharacterized protein (DUF305 family)
MSTLTICTRSPSAFDRELLSSVRSMEMELSQAQSQLNGDVDHDFMLIMTRHHDGAIKMAQNVLQYSTNPTVRSIATNIITSQTQGSAQMRRLLNSTQAANTSSQYSCVKIVLK